MPKKTCDFRSVSSRGKYQDDGTKSEPSGLHPSGRDFAQNHETSSARQKRRNTKSRRRGQVSELEKVNIKIQKRYENLIEGGPKETFSIGRF